MSSVLMVQKDGSEVEELEIERFIILGIAIKILLGRQGVWNVKSTVFWLITEILTWLCTWSDVAAVNIVV